MPAENAWPSPELAAFTELALDPCCIVGADDHFAVVNEAFTRTLGWSRAELYAVPCLDFVHPDDVAQAARELARVRAGESSEGFESRFRRHDGAYVWLSWRGLARADGRIFGMASDVTTRRRASEQVHELQQRFRNAFDHSAIGMAIVGQDGSWLEVNAALCAMVGYTEAELLARTFQHITHPDDLAADVALAEEVRRGERPSYQLEKRYLHRDGHVVWVLIAVSAVRGADGAFLYYLTGIQDITRQKEALRLAEEHSAALAQANAELARARDVAEAAGRAQQHFLAAMTHEIRSPLNAVLGFGALLQDTTLSAEQRAFLEQISEGSEAVVRLVNDLLDLSHIEAGAELEQHQVDLRQLVGSVVSTYRADAVARHITLTSTVDDRVPALVLGDAQRLRQVLVKYLGNALRYTDVGAVDVSLTARSDEGATDGVLVHLAVRDTGAGIAAEQLGRLFQPILPGALPEAPEASGLGLSIVRRLAERMGGEAWAESVEGAGSVFHFTARLRDAAPAPEKKALRGAEPGIPPDLRVLMAEDLASNRMLVQTVLGRAGLRADEVEDGHEALEAVVRAAREGRPYDVVFMDVQMPVMDGLEATRRIRAALPPAQQPRIIAVTAAVLAADFELCMQAGMDLYISKPFVPRRFLKALAQVVADR
jgi:PAS domain S-box-containing protein